MIDIYTDGACSGNPGPGGWAAIIIQGEERQELQGGAEKTTNNRMELTAAIEGLARTPSQSRITIHSDSRYLVNTMTRNWKRNANTDLWKRLDELTSDREVHWIWVPGHMGNPENERADRLAVEMIEKKGGQPTHFDDSGKVRMVDVTDKDVTDRTGMARGTVTMQPETVRMITAGEMAKGNVLALAQTAGIMGAKRTFDLIPLCHPLRLTEVSVDFEPEESAGVIHITATARASEKTGVEMEALTAVAISALTLYDMCKAVDRGMTIGDIRLIRKTGGKSGTFERE